MRHLVFSNQLHFCHWVLGPFQGFSPLGLASAHLADRPLFAAVGTAVDPSLVDVFAARAAIRDQIYVTAKELTPELLGSDASSRDGPEIAGKAFQGLCWHDFGHFMQCDAIFRKLRRHT